MRFLFVFFGLIISLIFFLIGSVHHTIGTRIEEVYVQNNSPDLTDDVDDGFDPLVDNTLVRKDTNTIVKVEPVLVHQMCAANSSRLEVVLGLHNAPLVSQSTSNTSTQDVDETIVIMEQNDSVDETSNVVLFGAAAISSALNQQQLNNENDSSNEGNLCFHFRTKIPLKKKIKL